MAETETADDSKNVIKVEEEIEGDQIGTRNYRFSKIGESVPIKSDTDFKFDMDSLPSRPMAVSERFGVIFVAHSSGFCVARTKDVMDTAEELKNGGNGSSIQELSVVDVSLGKVSILALSADSSLLAATVGFDLYFFSVEGLLNKDHEPSFSKSLNGSSCIKDMQWSPRLKDQYVVLTSDGNLYHASGQDDLNSFMKSVDAVNWSMNGKFLAVVRNGILRVLSSKFEEKLRIKLLFDSMVDDSDADSVVKVDSVRWVRPDCIILGLHRLNGEGKEESYLVQLVSVKEDKITNPSSNPVALTFSDAFLSINDYDIPSGSGPHMFVSYLDEYEVAFVANRKNTDQHIVLFSWSPDKDNGAEMIEITFDAWLPTINLQDNSDDNLILGLAVDKVYKDEKLRLTLGDKDTEVSPCCILLCLTIDAKLFMFHFASATGPSVINSESDEEEESPSLNVVNNEKQIEDQDLHKLQPQKVKVDELQPPKQIGDLGLNELQPQKVKVDEPSEAKSSSISHSDKGGTKQEVPVVSLNSSKDQGQTLPSQKQEGSFSLFKSSEPVNLGKKSEPSADSFTKSAIDKNKTLFGASTESSVNKASSGPVFSSNLFGAQSFSSPLTSGLQGRAESSSGKLGFTNPPFSSGSFSSGPLFSSKTFDTKPLQGNPPPFSSNSQKLSFPNTTSSSGQSQTTSSNLIGRGGLAGTPVINTSQSLGKSSDYKGNHRSQTQSRMLSSEPNLSEQRSVEEMAKELDTLLESIQAPGGFYDACVAALKPSVTALEEGISVLSQRCRNWTDTMDRTGEVQLLLDKTVQVLARKTYMGAILKQATDSQYLDIWNRQKLSSELDMKRRHILEINQNLTNQLIELERHLNTLEFQRFGDKGEVEINRRSSRTRHGPPRHVQSLHSLHNTMNAQLAAAEKLSECLSKQMAVLRIDTEPVKKQNVKKELFDTIGISYDEKPKEVAVKSKILISSSSASGNLDKKKTQQSSVKSSEPETARRRRDSLDRSWASIQPPKTTVKRMLLQEDRQISPARLSFPTATQNRSSVGPVVSQTRGSQDLRIKQLSDKQPSSSLWGNYSSPPVTSGLQSTPIVNQDVEKSRSRLTFNLKSDPVVVNDPKFSQPSQSFPEPSVKNIFQKKPIEYSESSNKDFGKPKISAEASSIWSKKSQESSFSTLSSATSSTAFSGKSFSLESSSSSSSTKENPVSSSVPSLPVPVTLTPSSFVFKDATSSLTSAKPSASFGIKSGATQPVSLPASSLSFPSFLSSVSAQVSRPNPVVSSGVTTGPSVSLPKFDLKPDKNSSAPNPEVSSVSTTGPSVSLPKFDLKLDKNSSTPNPVVSSVVTTGPSVSLPKFDLKPNENSSVQIPPSNPVVSSVATTSPSVSLPTFDLKLDQNSSAQVSPPNPVVSSVATTGPSLNTFSSPISNPVDVVTQEDEMEEEAPSPATEAAQLNMGGFGLGSSSNPAAPKQNPFGAPFGNPGVSAPVPSFTAPQPGGGLFKPASFNIESSPPSQPANFGGFSGGFGGSNNQSGSGSGLGQGFGQPARIGSGQQALGSVLGAFGQSRQVGAPAPFGGGFGGGQPAGGGFATASSGGGFANLASGGGGGGFGGGFAAAATGGGGFAAAATGGGGGFAGAATGGGGFGAAATDGGGFGAAATGGGGFGGAPAAGGGFGGAPTAGGGGFGGFSSQGGSGFSTFGSSGGTGKPPELFTQMRR